MRKHLFFLACMAICLVFLVGCGAYDKSAAAEGAKNVNQEISSSKHTDIADWKATAFDTVNNLAGVTMAAKKGTESATELTVIFDNSTKRQCIYGEYFSIEKKIDGSWYQVPVAINGNYGFNSIGYELSPGDKRETKVEWEWLYGSLDKGEYRIVKDILDFRGTGDYDSYYLTAEFMID